MFNADSIRPSGIRRKLMKSDVVAVETAGDYIIGYFPNGAVIRNIHFVTTVAIGTADCSVDIGVAKDGDTVVDGRTFAYSGNAIGTVIDVFNTKGTNGGVTEIAPGGLLWAQSDGGSTNGSGFFVIEYEDRNN